MPLVFQNKPGQVVMLDDPALSCNTSFMGFDPADPNSGIYFETERSIVTRLTVSQQVNVQFLHSLGSLIHVYVFGDRMGSVSLSGLSFACECPNGAEIGAEKMLLWYKRNRASKRATPLRVTIGKSVIEGYVTGFNEDVVDPSMKLVQWGVTMASLPEDD